MTDLLWVGRCCRCGAGQLFSLRKGGHGHGYQGNVNAAARYNSKAEMMTTVKPNCIASKDAMTALTTEAQPLMPHAQGMNPGISAPTRCSPRGNGMPMQKASGAISRMLRITRRASDRDIRLSHSGPSRKL